MRVAPIRWAVSLSLVVAAFSLGCGGDGSPTGEGNNNNPTISISLSATSISLEQQTGVLSPPSTGPQRVSSAATTVTVTRGGGYTGSVAIAVEGTPSGVTATADPSSILSGSTSSEVALSAGPSATPGSHTITVRATGSGVAAATATLNLTVTAAPVPAFGMSVAPNALSLVQGETGASTVSLTRSGGFTGEVALAVTGMPTGMTAAAAPASTAGASSTITVSVGAAVVPSVYTLVVTGTALGLTNQTAAFQVTVTEAVTGSFSLSMDPAVLSIEQGNQASATVQINRTGGFAGDVALAVSGLAAGVTATFDPPNSPEMAPGDSSEAEAETAAIEGPERPGGASRPAGSLGPEATTGNSATLTLTVGGSVTPGNYPLTITGTAAGLEPQTTSLSTTVTVAVPESFTLALNPSSLSVQQGAGANSTLTITRGGGFAGAVAFSVAGQPAGMTATTDPTSTAGNSSTISVTVGAGVTPGTYPLVVTGTATGLPNQTANLSVTVTAGGAGGEQVSFTFCDETGLPLWVAYQDGNGAWTQVVGVANTYTFNLSQAKGGVAFVMDQGGGETTTQVFFGTAQELANIGANYCENPAGTSKDVNGSVAGLGLTDQSTISMAGAGAALTGIGPATFMLQNVSDGPRDLIATRVSLAGGGGGFQSVLNKLIIRRGLNPVNGATLPVLDFGSGEAFDPETRNLTINNLGADQAVVSTTYYTNNGTVAVLHQDLTNSGTYSGVGAPQQSAGDLHSITIGALDDPFSPSAQRSYSTWFTAAVDKTVTLGPAMNTVALSTASAAPYVRLRGMFTVQSEYDGAWTLNFAQSGGNAVAIIVTAGHQGGGATFDYTIPDFTPAGGWNNAWGLVAGTEVNWVLSGTGWTTSGGIIGAPVIDGAVALSGSRFGKITP